ncbi:MAG: hypothetical protein JXA90_04975, partial [Planctomycetes bacterium]|nr:hypothetical protein [Planctomycetota bacterium]
ARAADDGRLEAGGSRARALVLPRDVRLPAEAASVSERFAARGGRIVEGAAGLGALDRAVRLEPPTDRICAGRFERDGWKILVLVNTGRADYRGEAALRLRGTGWTLDPDAGSVVPRPFGDDGSTEISLAGRQTLIIAGREASARP